MEMTNVKIQMPNTRLVSYAVIFILLAEAGSFFSFLDPEQASVWFFGTASVAAIILTVRRLEYGVMLIFGELAIGSFGRMLEISVFGLDVSIRMALWLVVMAVWLAHAIQKRRIEFLHSKLFKPYAALAVILGWGIVWGIIRGNNLGAVFFDANNYLYFVLIFPVYDVLRQPEALRRLSTVIAIATGYIAAKTVILFYIFSHELFALQDILYAWSRKMQLAEITNISPLYITSRIFMQSQVWILFGLFVGLGYLLSLRGADSAPKQSQNQITGSPRSLRSLAMTILLSALVMSFSRSFWLAAAVSLALLGAILLLVMRERFVSVLRFGGVSIVCIVLAVGLTLGVAAFPIPRGSESLDLIKERAAQFTGESAVSSRYAQIRPLFESIKTHPLLGSGFGTAVTYESQDPRILKNHPDGRYTTTAFELGYLEMWLKIGLLGVGVYLYLLWMIMKTGWKQIKFRPDRYLVLGGLTGLAAVVITHGVSPYLNHPLGVGIVMFVTAIIDQRSDAG